MQREFYYNSISTLSKDFKSYDIVIVGAGLSGLTAAFRLFQLKPYLRIKILEAKDRIGGRLYSTELPASACSIDVWDLGGSWIGNKAIQPFINQLLADLSLSSYPQYFSGKKVLQAGKNSRISFYDSKLPDIGLFSLWDTSQLMKNVDKAQNSLFKTQTKNHELSDFYDSITMDTFIKQRVWSECTVDCARAAFRATFGCELDKISMLYALTYFNSCGCLRNLIESSEDSCQGFKIVGGAQRICTRILEIIGPEVLELESVVSSISEDYNEKDERFSTVVTSNGDSYLAKHVVLSIPTQLITNIQFQPPLSSTKYEYFSSVSPGHIIKVILTYETAFWRNSGFSGEIVTNGGISFTEGCSTGPLTVVFDATTPNMSPALMGIIGGKQAFEYEDKTKEERKEAVLRSLETFFGGNEVRNFIVYCEKVWRQEPFVGGCPVSHVPTGVGKCINQILRAPENQIHFAISELAQSWMGFMEGAVESGEKAALEIVSQY